MIYPTVYHIIPFIIPYMRSLDLLSKNANCIAKYLAQKRIFFFTLRNFPTSSDLPCHPESKTGRDFGFGFARKKDSKLHNDHA